MLSEQPMCHFTPMEHESGDSDDTGFYEEWFTCNHCGHVKDLDGKKVDQ